MPSRRDPELPASSVVATTPPTAIATMEDSVRADLLRTQRGMLDERQRLPTVRLMQNGVGLFEFSDTHDTVRDFQGVVLGAHPRNVLWDKAFGVTPTNTEEPTIPACSSNDGKFGIPRQGFRHAALGGRAATGRERINCRECPYNEWGSKALLPDVLRPGETLDTVKGKGVNNQRAVYVMVEGRQAPVQLLLPPTSIIAFDEYLAFLVNREMPIQAIITVFSQEIKNKGALRWGQATFTQGEAISQALFSRVLAVRQEWLSTIEGHHAEMVVAADVEEPGTMAEPEQREPDDSEVDEQIPF